ncbi:MAG: aminopeptidase [Thermoplasmatales archaeon SG8-52-3]|nr:MAG: aminopeptidase [Thermoplasmatales archaeon SG8-52-3]
MAKKGKKKDSKKDKESKYAYKKKTAWEIFTKAKIKSAFEFCEDYKFFLNSAKTEREAIQKINEIAKSNKKNIIINREKEAAIIVTGKKPISSGLRIVISHIDCPRLDLKQIPLYEDTSSNVALFETHYYGGIKKYQWVIIPLSLHGIVIKKDGKKVEFALGEDDSDPIFSVPDLLPHLAYKVQAVKKLDDAITGESLDVTVGSQPVKNEVSEKIKEGILEKLHKDYGITEEDFISAELEAVPAFKARDMGFDRSLIGAYGQDDRACAYTCLKAILDLKKPEYTAIALFVDKEEIGSEGNTTAQVSTFLRTIIKKLDPKVDPDDVMLKSKVVSADVNAAVTPNYVEVFELKNASTLGCGVVMSKFTGHGGKYAANDASAEYVSEIRTLLNKEKIPWQAAELGRVDTGGGGTVAKYFSRLGMEVIDLGPPVMSMHSPYEVTCKVDIYSSYLAYKAFLMK